MIRLSALVLILVTILFLIAMEQKAPLELITQDTRIGAKVLYASPVIDDPKPTKAAQNACNYALHMIGPETKTALNPPKGLADMQTTQRAKHQALDGLNQQNMSAAEKRRFIAKHNHNTTGRNRNSFLSPPPTTREYSDPIQRLKNDVLCVSCKPKTDLVSALRQSLRSRCDTSDQ